jgi:pyridoxal/pyridoxine/pyridoxamine kinase
MCARYEQTALIDVRSGSATLMIDAASKEKITGGYVEQENTIEKLFTIIHQAIEAQVDSIKTDYDPVLGYPSFIRIDRNQATFDEEIEYSILLTMICTEILIQPEC